MENDIQQKNLQVTPESISHLVSIRKWALFLSIMGFIGSAFMVLGGFFMGAMSRAFDHSEFGGTFSSIFIMVLYVGLGILYFFPSLFLFKFSSYLKSAIETCLDSKLTEALGSLRSFFTFTGVMTIIMIVIGVVAFAAVIVLGIMGAMMAGS
ncbi:MAG: hypothetical protein JXA06_02075 [Bacteroidetes bacterium]|nr:hypothetical protein [Bacteroidota bacterium]